MAYKELSDVEMIKALLVVINALEARAKGDAYLTDEQRKSVNVIKVFLATHVDLVG